MGSIPYNSVSDFNPISPTAGSKLDEKVGGQVELNGEARDVWSLHRWRIIVINRKKIENTPNIWQ